MRNENNKREFVVRFLQQLEDEAIIANVLNSINDNNSFDTLLESFPIYYSFVFPSNTEDESKINNFWINNIEDYKHLYVYAMLLNWCEQWDGFGQIKERFFSFQGKYSKNIEEEIEDLNIKEHDLIPQEIIIELMFVIDTFMWNRYKVMPINIKTVKTKRSYDRYYKLLNNFIGVESKDINFDEEIKNLSAHQ